MVSPSVNQLKLGLHQHRPQADRQALRPKARPARAGSAIALSASVARRATARGRARARRRDRPLRAVVSGGPAGSGEPRRGRQQAIHVRLGVEDEEAHLRVERGSDLAARVLERRCSAEAREAPAGDVVDEARRRRTRTPSPVGWPAAPRPSALAQALRFDRRQRRERRGLPSAPTSSAPAHTGSTRSGAFEP